MPITQGLRFDAAAGDDHTQLQHRRGDPRRHDCPTKVHPLLAQLRPGVSANNTNPNRGMPSGYLASRPAAMSTQNPISHAMIAYTMADHSPPTL